MKFKKCKCGHTHIVETGGEDGYTLTKERLIECPSCKCEIFQKLKGLKWK